MGGFYVSEILAGVIYFILFEIEFIKSEEIMDYKIKAQGN